MRNLAGLTCIIAAICFLGLPVILAMLVLWVFISLANYALGGDQ
ncbi:hypothetical protein N0P26_002969 [Acinetobacter baumannii]|uniref:Putative membrane protein n=2 Tax=Acinetobacter baumannii TaxID=470 RepID=A0A009HNC1_ACIB9|nr:MULTISPECIES: hypothetical protein [Acinetobacter]EXG35418.1 putative membrane protein [Acinetobacter baumannii 121738]EXB05642.1 putative membrane protein [Acinetobacter baumannii 1295743]EXB30071.1 putative membrane protein [Acinetobacter baumannii 1419130]EXB92752.1 putative membrane protein [Acinetobacter baumannii 466760]EXC08655.1 putative membrane protein [Acinetobacter baumannii 625974]